MKHENQNIEELLNSFIDGELTEREKTKVQRLLSHDAEAERRLRELRKSKILVSSLPRAEAPAQILENVKASLEIGTQSAERVWSEELSDSRVGARHLMFRKVLAAAAMVGLVAVLSTVIYTVVAHKPDYRPPRHVVAFEGRLELKTNVLSAVNTSIDKVIEDSGLSNSIRLTSQGDKRIYSITCSKKDLTLLLSDLADVWKRCNSSTLFVETEKTGRRKFDDVSNDQVIMIVNDLLIPVKPNFTSGDNEIEKPTGKQETKKQVHLSIVVAGSE
jgi:hypothetical protein